MEWCYPPIGRYPYANVLFLFVVFFSTNSFFWSLQCFAIFDLWPYKYSISSSSLVHLCISQHSCQKFICWWLTFEFWRVGRGGRVIYFQIIKSTFVSASCPHRPWSRAPEINRSTPLYHSKCRKEMRVSSSMNCLGTHRDDAFQCSNISETISKDNIEHPYYAICAIHQLESKLPRAQCLLFF